MHQANGKVLGLALRPIDTTNPTNQTPPNAFSVNGTDNYLPRLAWWARR